MASEVKQPEIYWTKPNAHCPNNRLPVLVFRGVLPEDLTEDSARKLIEANNWYYGGTFKHYPTAHFHSNTHECYAALRGSTKCLYGVGPLDDENDGVRFDMKAGDIAVHAAGVAHRNTESTPDYLYMGLYPKGAPKWNNNFCRADLAETNIKSEEAAKVPVPDYDPIAHCRQYGEMQRLDQLLYGMTWGTFLQLLQFIETHCLSCMAERGGSPPFWGIDPPRCLSFISCQYKFKKSSNNIHELIVIIMPQYGPVGEFPVSGKIVAVTGGGSGIGFAFAKLCHSKGARVLIGDLKLTPEAQDLVSKASDSEVAFQKCDVTSWDDLHDLISTSVQKFGAVPDVYAPVAGIYEPSWSNFWDDETSGSYKTIRINVDHPIKFTRLAVKALAGAEKQGVVCLVASTAGIRANYLASLYTASKHAIVGFAKAMGQADIDEGVRINCILPGLVSSPLWHDREDKMINWGKFDGRKQLQPTDIAEVMVKMVESKEYEGGTCVLKTPYEERIEELGHIKSLEKLKEYDPSPRPEPALDRINNVMQTERGKKWT